MKTPTAAHNESLSQKKIPVVDVKNLSFVTDGKEILSKISFKISKGDFLGIIGPNGAGKSTLLKCILGLEKPTSGSITLFGEHMFSDWKRIGYVPQRATGFDQNFPATVSEIVEMGQRSGPSSGIDIALSKVGMAEFKNTRIGRLSGGQQQRVFIARALAGAPELLILDEPTTGVDAHSQDAFYDLLGKLNSEEKLTIILISHDVGYITKYVTKVACLNQKLLFHGTHREFCSSDIVDKVLGHDKHLVCHTHND
ncbi:MAG: ABC transporter ATP-binding protein [Nanoarchaeota archaeon]|nr:ABC transporter ATP-binding protein [Nanoarchaeota archaeon]